MEDDSIPDHKLCGFLSTVLTVTPTPNDPAELSRILPINTRCHIFGSSSGEVGFMTENNVTLSPINPNAEAIGTSSDSAATMTPETDETQDSHNFQNSGTNSTPYRKKKWSGIGMVNGSISVVHKLHALVMHKCLKINAIVLRNVFGDSGEVRVVVLVDVYLPIALWSGWQFPKSVSTAAALFRHLSCDWETRRLMLEFGNPHQEDGNSIWNLYDCHVLQCKQHCSAPDSSKKKLFELHGIFKSLPSVAKKGDPCSSRINPDHSSCGSGIWVLPDDVLFNILTALGPIDLIRVSETCRHLRFVAASVMPCMKLKLFPHQQTAVEWMLKRERDPEVLPHPLFMDFATEDGFAFYINSVSGEIVTGEIPTIKDFCGGMFCDEPGLGKTITALSLILKTQGTLAEPLDGVEAIWCRHASNQRCGYYELSRSNAPGGRLSKSGRVVGQTAKRGQLCLGEVTRGENHNKQISGSTCLNDNEGTDSPRALLYTPATRIVRCTRSWSHIRKNLLDTYDESVGFFSDEKVQKSSKRRRVSHSPSDVSLGFSRKSSYLGHRHKIATGDNLECNETWIQCDACHKWRKLSDSSIADTSTAWFCSMNSDTLHQSCTMPEESWDYRQSITSFPGFHTKGTSGEREENVSFFAGVLKEHYMLLNSETKKALAWLAKLSPAKISEMETIGLVHPVTETRAICAGDSLEFHKIFQAFGLIKRVEKGTTRWFYPKNLVNLVFDLAALRVAFREPLDSLRLYLSRATLVVVPANLVDHWKTQIQKHVRPGQLRVYVWTDNRKPCAHNLAWDYDVVITTFSRLSAEWNPRNRSVLMQIHWLRVMLDEGHTLGSSLNLTNKLQMAISLTASNRWLLTGTPTPNTPNSQLSHLQPMLKFLREEAYGQNQKSWDAGILRPFEAEMEEGHSRLLQLLCRCTISARKTDLQTIPPCIKKVTFLHFTEEHARSYNELVVTVRRNILMADWKDPSHVESLLNPKQWKFRCTTIGNVRLSCCVAGHIKVANAGQDIQETMDILVENGLDPTSEEYAFILCNLLHGGSCMRCKEWCRLPIITPCRHLLCLDCVALDSEKCTFPGCSNLYEMQSPETLARPENPNPKWPVPKDLIELQPSYKQDDWHPEWQSTSSSKVSYIVQKLKDLQEANIINGYSKDVDNDAKIIDKKHEEFYTSCSDKSYQTPPEKVLIFSQFLEHIHVIEQQLTLAGIKFAGLYSPMHSSNKMKSLTTFQHDANCMALLMDGSAALGLDLSFVTHVFLMEPIWDRSMEEQVVSRAHRMGATRPIHVETLAMRGTIEEQMLRFLQDADQCRRLLKEESGKHDREGARVPRTLHDFAESNYLAKLSFVRTNFNI